MANGSRCGAQECEKASGHDPESGPSFLYGLTQLPLFLYRILRWRGLRGGWLPDHLRAHKPFSRHAMPWGRPIDVMVLVTDHFEPARRFGDAPPLESVRPPSQPYHPP